MWVKEVNLMVNALILTTLVRSIIHGLMKYLLITIIACLLVTPIFSQKKEVTTSTTFVLVRHAEKAQDGSKDPALTAEGQSRAERLSQLLDQENISALYATPYQRTQLTLKPIADSRQLEINTYKPFEEGFLNNLLLSHPDQIVVIAGHSNTIPALVNALIGEDKFSQLDESDYNDIFIVTASEVGDGTAIQLTY